MMLTNSANTLSVVVIEELQPSATTTTTSITTQEVKKVLETTSMECRTPTAKEYKISEVMTCPPAPRKKRVFLSPQSWDKVKVRVVKEFFSSPELESILLNRGVPSSTSTAR